MVSPQPIGRDRPFEIGLYLERGWQLFRQNWQLYVPFGLILFAFGFILGMASSLLQIAVCLSLAVSIDECPEWVPQLVDLPFNLISWLVGTPLGAGPVVAALLQLQHQTPEFSDFFKGFRRFWPLVLTSFLIGFIIFIVVFVIALVFGAVAFLLNQAGTPVEGLVGIAIVGVLLAIAAATYIGVGYLFVTPIVLDRRIGVWQALELSRQVVAPRWWSAFGFLILLGLINGLGFLACCVGLLVTIPVTLCAIAVAYSDQIGLETAETAV
ncbi:DUF975 family protein [Synechococcus elongatus]|uniref:Glycerophosphoryl diester phosphodiesterase membrane domain-containing protein n=2 Tax=Synechococcus elongatus TaxID=32046 RepID=Q31KG5_SYNE7|nr:DUF975 family protein [Synechococcus elongatus]ABB58454.1 conserved hypothetical protein [Synechococcus elongatus PCC 7942 = FACHB-805]AJD57085.1 hypothetical protein M744_04125 [Synechococcus elongatus UTEX 2973]MBD2587174.1 DUF975 family protein [Synechococcus elongatus FACHB-242]MBD2688245.1 DUF975 family protein [Synechococcus elongatus FACHB-1061]MBD2706044.1 DUF975 family protein [Synechococcus elongatus PCC 7942 = FACHB-805]